MAKTIKVPSVPQPTKMLCWAPQPLLQGMARCDRMAGHGGPHSWEWRDMTAICKCGHLIDQTLCLHCIIEEYRQANPQGPTLTQTWPVADERDVAAATRTAQLEQAQQEIERLLERIDRVRDYITTAMRPQSVEAACSETAYDRAHRAGLQHALNALDAEEFKKPQAEALARPLAQQLEWLTNLGCGVGKAGGRPSAFEFEDAIENAKATIALAPVQALLKD